jgi:hypothetical protein
VPLFLQQPLDYKYNCEKIEMTKLEYFKTNKKILFSLFKLIGAIVTGVIALLFIVTSFHFKSLMDVFYLFLTCFILGNFIAFSLVLSYFSIDYSSVRDQFNFFNSLDDDTKKEFRFRLYFPPTQYKYSLPEAKILCNYESYLFEIRADRPEKKIMIYVFNDLEGIDLSRAMSYADKQYKNDSICLSELGLQKTIKYKDWKRPASVDFRSIFIELLKISGEESLLVMIENEPED